MDKDKKEILPNSKFVSEFDMSVITMNLLKKAKIPTIGDLVRKTEADLLKNGFGKKSLEELKDLLSRLGLSLGMGIDEKKIKDKANTTHESVALGLFDNKIRLVSLYESGECLLIGEHKELFPILYVSSEISILQKTIDELESLLHDQNTTEPDLQDFLEKNPDFLRNLGYREVHPKVVLHKDKKKDKKNSLIPDFILEPFDQNQLCDLLDLKPPSAKVYVLKKNRPRFSAAVMEACSQLWNYSNFFDEEKNQEKIVKQYGLLLYKPQLLTIIGRREKIDPVIKRKIEVYVSDLRVYTYDDLIAKMKIKIESLKKGRKDF